MVDPALTTLDLKKCLQENFGLDSFRRGQKRVIDSILAGHDTLCIMPTGGGKSLCYQLPTIAREGTTIVISPLIALMKDQVDSLTEIGISATFINSSLATAEQHARIDGMVEGRYKLVYIAPERLRSVSFLRAVRKTNIQFLAIDEAHCISQWGHDFRPDYARLGRFRERLGNPQTIALTATATQLVREDIAKVLNLQNPNEFITGFSRENLSLHVKAPQANSEKDQILIDYLKEHQGCGIIYASTRKNCEHLVELLDGKINRPISFYHAGLAGPDRRRVQEDFMSGEIPIIVATNAFGMGIDKSDLRFVVHYNLPGSVEAYYQEAGRAGRDGLPSKCLLLYSYQDRFIQEFFIDNSYPAKETIKEVYDYLRSIKSNPIEKTLAEIKEDLGLSLGSTGIANCENLLEKAGAIERLDSQQNMAGIKIDSELSTLIDYLPRDARTQRHVMRGLEALVGPMRGERVMFRPQKFAERMEMKWEAVNRAIKQLVKLDAIDYVPPFRGRAIHMLCRDKPFSKLKIDFEELGRRQKAEVEKLERVIRLATSRRCRQLEILEYFGDPDRKICGNCDNCIATGSVKKSKANKNADEDACLYAVQVALSGVARTHGRFGKGLIAKMLHGSTAKQVVKTGLPRLTTYGLLGKLKQTDVVKLMDWLTNAGYLIITETTKFRPTVEVSPSGKKLMSGKDTEDLLTFMPTDLINVLSKHLKGMKPKRAAQAPPVAPTPYPESTEKSDEPVSIAPKLDDQIDEEQLDEFEEIDEELEAELNAELADEVNDANRMYEGDDSVVEEGEEEDDIDDEQESPEFEAAESHATEQGELDHDDDESNENDLEHVEFEQADPELFESNTREREPAANHFKSSSESTATFSNPRDDAQPPTSESLEVVMRVDLPSPETVKPSFYWTWQLLSDGYSVDHLEQVRQIDRETLVNHVIQASEDQLPIHPHWLLNEEQIESLERLVSENPRSRLSQLASKLPETVSTPELMFFLQWKKQHNINLS